MIELKNVSFAYLSELERKSLCGINLSIHKGEFVLLTGASGCGKTTILRLLNGLIPNYYEGELTGEIFVAGKDIAKQPLYETAMLTGTVFQNPRTQFYNVDTTSELAFGSENQGVPEKEILDRMEHTVGRFQIERLMKRNIFHLSGGEKQQIACASVDVENTDIILLDEPSANLDFEATKRLKNIISMWKREGKTIVAAEHRIAYLWDMADRTLVMKDGAVIREWDREAMDLCREEDLAALGLRSFRQENPKDVPLPECEEKDEFLLLKDFSFSYEKKAEKFLYSDIRIPLGEIIAVTGDNGVGKTTFLHCLCGLKRQCKGMVYFREKWWKRKKRSGLMFLVMQDVGHQLFTESVMDEVLLSMREENGDTALEILKSLELDGVKERHPLSLSGGQMQRVAVASAIASGREILLFDEPTSGLDYGHMMEMAKLLYRLKQMGKTVLVVTHDSEFIRACCSRKIVLDNREQVKYGRTKEGRQCLETI